MENQFIRHEPCFERILFVLTLDRKKMKERILIGEEQQIRFRLNGSQNAEVLCDMTRPLGTFLINFERDTDRDWNLYGLSPLRQALHSNRWKQPELEQAASEFLWGKYLSNDPLKMYVAFRIWNSYLLAREPRDRNAACDRFMDKMSRLTGVFQNETMSFDRETGKPKHFQAGSLYFKGAPSEDTRLDLWFPDNRRTEECVSAYTRPPAILHAQYGEQKDGIAQHSGAKAGKPCVCGEMAPTERDGEKLRNRCAQRRSAHQQFYCVDGFFFSASDLSGLDATLLLCQHLGKIDTVK